MFFNDAANKARAGSFRAASMEHQAQHVDAKAQGVRQAWVSRKQSSRFQASGNTQKTSAGQIRENGTFTQKAELPDAIGGNAMFTLKSEATHVFYVIITFLKGNS